jgi:hypothetical protein
MMDNIIVVYTSIFTFLDSTEEENLYAF